MIFAVSSYIINCAAYATCATCAGSGMLDDVPLNDSRFDDRTCGRTATQNGHTGCTCTTLQIAGPGASTSIRDSRSWLRVVI